MNTLNDFFQLAMDRTVPEPLVPEPGLSFDLGASGTKVAPGATPLGLPDWRWPRDRIPADDNSVTCIHAYHFLEHLSGEDAIAMLREIERVLVPGGVVNFCMPYYNTSLAGHDLTHKSSWNEDTFRNLFKNDYYDMAGEWKLRVHFVVIMGIVERNIALLGQLTK